MSWTLLSAVTLPCKFLHAGVLNLLRPQLKCVLNESNPPVHSPPSLPVWLLLTLLSTVFCLFPLQKHVLVGVHGLSVGADSVCGPHLLCWSSVWKQQHPPPELHPGLLWDGISARWHLFFFPPRPSFSWNVLVISYFHLSFICKQVCDTYLKFGLPLIVMPPPGVFYQALFSIDPVSVDHLAFIMFRSELRVASIV